VKGRFRNLDLLRTDCGLYLVKLEALLVCSVETDLLKAIPNERIYGKLSAKSSEMKRLLMFFDQSIQRKLNTCLFIFKFVKNMTRQAVARCPQTKDLLLNDTVVFCCCLFDMKSPKEESTERVA
jgi:hypothetical protein